MKLKFNDRVVGMDADGEPVAGRVAGIDAKNGRVTIRPSICGPIAVAADSCHSMEEPGGAASAPATPETPPAAPPSVPVEPV